MGNAYILLLVVLVVILLLRLFMTASPAAVASLLKQLLPMLAIGIGLVLLIAGRPGIGMALIFFGGSYLLRQRRIGRISGTGSGKPHISTVRSAWLEMQLDHDTGDLEGTVLTGHYEGEQLSNLDDATLLELYNELKSDAESLGLMEAYLDRRIPAWREYTQGGSGSGESHAASPGPMSKQEAYQVLGLAEGASAAEIKAAHRRLMKAVHPDSGGSTFLAARINEAKDLLLD